MVAVQPTVAEIWKWLEAIADPEIPVLSITDLAIVRDIQWNAGEDKLVVTITPTYSGCPAMDAIADEIRRSMKEHGIDRLELVTKLSPPWTTDWMSDQAKQRLREYGIAPPRDSLVQIEEANPACPQCGSPQTKLISRYGSTPCKALYKCLSCLEPFDAFKRH
ncbi:MAG TPA: 1,2-phenylacetyl-CoA epoxidase subunit PaaD [Bryobacteraceae bacterium]|nr:1,2-phenylacetyl-CoA epoxidase subunit PaaD [Bryobacteraceae bacterium]